MNDLNYSEPKLFGLPRRFIGAIFGILIFLLITVPTHAFQLQSKPLLLLFAGIISPGTTIWFILMWIIQPEISTASMQILMYLFIFGISSIPVAILGSLLISAKKYVRTLGFVLLAGYFVIISIGSYYYYGFFKP